MLADTSAMSSIRDAYAIAEDSHVRSISRVIMNSRRSWEFNTQRCVWYSTTILIWATIAQIIGIRSTNRLDRVEILLRAAFTRSQRRLRLNNMLLVTEKQAYIVSRHAFRRAYTSLSLYSSHNAY